MSSGSLVTLTKHAGLAVSPLQAVPSFFVKFQKVFCFFTGSKHVFVREAVLFVIHLLMGHNRGSELGRLLASQVFTSEDH